RDIVGGGTAGALVRRNLSGRPGRRRGRTPRCCRLELPGVGHPQVPAARARELAWARRARSPPRQAVLPRLRGPSGPRSRLDASSGVRLQAPAAPAPGDHGARGVHVDGSRLRVGALHRPHQGRAPVTAGEGPEAAPYPPPPQGRDVLARLHGTSDRHPLRYRAIIITI
ncbi:unnamed protein product, partial [Ectocarpus fasciculatus]